MLSNQHSFSIENKLIPESDQPFGPDYHGQFTVRRPTLADKKAIGLKDAASMSIYGPVNPEMLGEGMKLLSYICIYVAHIAEEPLPAWFSMDKMYSDTDEDAIMAVWAEVRAFLATFRPIKNTGNGGEPKRESAALV